MVLSAYNKEADRTLHNQPLICEYHGEPTSQTVPQH